MKMSKRWSLCFWVVFAGLSTLFFPGACKAKEEAMAEKVEVELDEITLDTIKPIMGEAKDDMSGVIDLTKGENELIMAYRFYTTDTADLDSRIGLDLAPKLKTLYRQFKLLDRIFIGLNIPRAGAPGEWKPYVSFVVTRKIMNETDWAAVLEEDFLKATQDLKYAE